MLAGVCTKCFLLFSVVILVVFLNLIISIFPIVKMAENTHKSIGSVVWLQCFNKFHLFEISEIFTILLWDNSNLKSMKKSNTYFLIKQNPKIQFTIEIVSVSPICRRKINATVNI